ncbi:MAG: dCTP deaminase, partial [Pseudomonadota bacterium]
VGFKGFWTLEMFAVQPIKIYPGIKICQIFYHQIHGNVKDYVSDKYQNNQGIQPSLLFKELCPEGEHELDPQLTLGFGE